MKSTMSNPEPDADRRKATQEAIKEKAAADDSSGGAPATEEDIGTEGAGTESRETTQPKRNPQAPNR